MYKLTLGFLILIFILKPGFLWITPIFGQNLCLNTLSVRLLPSTDGSVFGLGSPFKVRAVYKSMPIFTFFRHSHVSSALVLSIQAGMCGKARALSGLPL